jgi:hypothetical protein
VDKEWNIEDRKSSGKTIHEEEYEIRSLPHTTQCTKINCKQIQSFYIKNVVNFLKEKREYLYYMRLGKDF